MTNFYVMLLKQFARGLDNADFEKYVEEVQNVIEEEKLMRGLK